METEGPEDFCILLYIKRKCREGLSSAFQLLVNLFLARVFSFLVDLMGRLEPNRPLMKQN